MNMHVKKNDTVVVVSGKYAGKKGKILKVFPEKERAIVEGVNLMKKHAKPGYQGNQQGGIMSIEAPINVSNLMLFCAKCNRPVRVAHKVLETGKSVRVCNKCQEMLTTNQ